MEKIDLNEISEWYNNYSQQYKVIDEKYCKALKLDNSLIGKIRVEKQQFFTKDDLIFSLYSNDHQPPHFHVSSKQKEYEIRISIDKCELISVKKGKEKNFYKDLKKIQYLYDGPNFKEKLLKIYTKFNSKKVQIKEIEGLLKQGKKVKIKSRNGEYVEISEYVHKGIIKTWKITLENKYEQKVAEKHKFFTNQGWLETLELIPNETEILCDDDQYHKVKSVEYIGLHKIVDVMINKENYDDQCYFGNGMLNHNTGKSFFLINLAKRAVDIGKNVVYVTLELAEGLIGKRFDSLISGITINELENRKIDVIPCVQEYLRNKGKLKIKQYPTKKASVATMQIYLDLLKRTEGFIPDLLVVDYADILKSNHRGEAKKRFELESVYEELRGLAVELNLPIITASQANKNSSLSEFVTMADMSESYSKAAISDVVLGINRRADGNLINYGTIYIAKNRGFGRDGLILPLSYNTSKASIDIPFDMDMLDKVKAGDAVNLAQYWFQKENIQFTNPNVLRFTSPQSKTAIDNIVQKMQQKKEVQQ